MMGHYLAFAPGATAAMLSASIPHNDRIFVCLLFSVSFRSFSFFTLATRQIAAYASKIRQLGQINCI